MGEPHVAKFVIRHDAGLPGATSVFSDFFQELTDIKADRRKRKAEQTHDAEELVREKGRDAHKARQNWRDGRRLSDKEYNSLNMYGQRLVDDYLSGALSVKVDRANEA